MSTLASCFRCGRTDDQVWGCNNEPKPHCFWCHLALRPGRDHHR